MIVGPRAVLVVLAFWAGALPLANGRMGPGAGLLCGAAGAEEAPAAPAPETQAAEQGSPVKPEGDNAPRPQIIPAGPSAYASVDKESLTAWVAKVNGDPISRAFFLRRLAAHRASAYIRFANASSTASGPEFWTTEHDGETPAQWLKQRALEECVRVEVELGLGKRHGLISDASYAAFLGALDEENQRRRAALARGEPIYGPQQYQEDDFFLYVINNLRLALENRLADDQLKPSDQALRELYEAVKDKYFSRGDRVRVLAIRITPRGEGRDESRAAEEVRRPGGSAAEEARARILEAKQRLDAGARFEEVAAEYSDGGQPQEEVFDPESPWTPKIRGVELRDQAIKLSEGEVSGVFQDMQASGAGPYPSGDTAYYIIKCIGKEPLGYQPFGEVEDAVRRIYLRQQYEALVDRLVKSARIEVNQAALDRIEIE